MSTEWLDPAPAGTSVCGGFDGSDVDDATAIRLETREGYQFTPRYGPDKRPTIWLPAEWGGVTPRDQVHVAWAEIAATYRLKRVYCDPFGWATELDLWDEKHGPDVFAEWRTNRPRQMFEALDRFTSDLKTRALTHDGCPITALHVANARKRAGMGDTYILQKPAQHQKIDAAVTSTLCHEAAADQRAEGWTDGPDLTRVSTAMYGFN